VKASAHPLAAALAYAVALASCDPVISDAKAALGDESPTVRRGPMHRPGQPCLLCHDGGVGDPPAFSVAGTVFVNPTNEIPAAAATITLTGADGKSFSAQTNAAGNFYVIPDDFAPLYPMRVTLTYQGAMSTMVSHVGRDGSCAGCHTDPPSFKSPGHVYTGPPVMPGVGGTP
jgi:hypothetical protein